MPFCDETVKLVQSIACRSCDVTVSDMHDLNVASRARGLGVRSVPRSGREHAEIGGLGQLIS